MILDPSAFWRFAAQVEIPTRDHGLFRVTEPFGTQVHLVESLARGLEDNVHEFVVLKGGRQVGGTTVFDLMDLYWPQCNPGLVGMVVANDDGNLEYRRDVILTMLESLPPEWRLPVAINNKGNLRWSHHGSGLGGSRLLFAAAGPKSGRKLGRSKGINYLHGDEVAWYQDMVAISALRASFSEQHASRFYAWISTANGYGPFHDMWRIASRPGTKSQRAIFLGWWQHRANRVAPDDPRWEEYWSEPSREEWEWMQEVRVQFSHEISPGQLVWWRWKLAEQFAGDEMLMAQEFGSVPERCFVAFGDKIIPESVVQRLRAGLQRAPSAKGYAYRWGLTLDSTQIETAAPDDAALVVWEEPQPQGVYIVAAHPWGASRPDAAHWVVEVYRAYPDLLEQVAEYAAELGTGYQFAWVIAHLCGAYRQPKLPPYLVIEIGGPGMAVLQELRRLTEFGYGISTSAEGIKDLRDLMSGVRHYLYSRPDQFRSSAALQMKTQPEQRTWLWNQLRDEVVREHVVPRSVALVDEFASLRRGEQGDADEIAGGGTKTDARAFCTALAAEHWLKTALPELRRYVAPKTPDPVAPKHVGEVMVGAFLDRIFKKGRA